MITRRIYFSWFLASFLVLSSSAVDFTRDIAPILIRECLACHSAEKAKGGYRVHNFSALLQPGKSKAAPIVPGKPDESELFLRLVTEDSDDRMPQDDEALGLSEIALVKEWITAGAKLDRGDALSNLALLLPREPHPSPPEYYPRPVPILGLAFSREGQSLATGGYHEVIIWNLQGELQHRITNAPQRIHSLTFDPSGNRLAIAGGKPGRLGELTVYENGRLLTNLFRSADEFLSVAFSPDGKLLAGSGADNSIRVFRTENWEPVNVIQQHADWVTSIAFNTEGTKLLSASRDRTSRIYDSESGELQTTYVNHSAAVSSAVFLPNEMVASAGREKIIHFWDEKEGQKRNQIGDIRGDIYELLSQDDFLFSAGADGQVKQFSSKDRKLLRTFAGDTDSVFSIAYHRATAKLAAGSYNGTVKIWDVKDGSLIASFSAAPSRAVASTSPTPTHSSPQ